MDLLPLGLTGGVLPFGLAGGVFSFFFFFVMIRAFAYNCFGCSSKEGTDSKNANMCWAFHDLLVDNFPLSHLGMAPTFHSWFLASCKVYELIFPFMIRLGIVRHAATLVVVGSWSLCCG